MVIKMMGKGKEKITWETNSGRMRQMISSVAVGPEQHRFPFKLCSVPLERSVLCVCFHTKEQNKFLAVFYSPKHTCSNTVSEGAPCEQCKSVSPKAGRSASPEQTRGPKTMIYCRALASGKSVIRHRATERVKIYFQKRLFDFKQYKNKQTFFQGIIYIS